MEKMPLVVLFGPTASGKTSLAVQMAKRIDGEVVTADSMQVYKHMNIGTAKPTIDEMEGVPHHLIDIVEPDENYSLSQYAEAAHKCIREVVSRGKTPILAGGTGLYIDTVVQNISLSEEVRDETYRKELLAFSEKNGNEKLMEQLRKVDAESAERLHLNDIKRIVRALEVFKATGIPQSEHIRRSKDKESPYDAHKFCIMPSNREKLYERINLRVDLMFEAGLLDEVKALYDRGIDERFTSMQGIGYKEVLEYFRGNCDLECAKENIKQSTRRYAKRQVSWFKREENTIILPMEYEKNLEIFQKSMEM
ncbi:MAG: tRNA (adenosine(37)-N6)-dimethylallyltransferase MiaA [Clostridia bacterium]|nr:tRNA (adenosine(37)-N6)-dimethylallyltransferase MiaA [Clostridia bacterium]